MIRNTTLLLFLVALAPWPVAMAQATATDAAAAVARLQKAIAGQDSEPALAAIEACGRIASDEVVKQLVRGLHHRDPVVQRDTLVALRHNPQPAALGALLAAAGNERLFADDQVAAAYYLALGQKADVRALPILTRNLHVDRGSEAAGARILALGRIRSPESVAALVQLMRSGDGGRRGSRRGGHGHNPHMRELRMALAALTGEDHGQDESEWLHWWAHHRDGFMLPAKEGELPRALARTWQAKWREPGNGPTHRQEAAPARANGSQPDRAR
jgi:hypothetical protein